MDNKMFTRTLIGAAVASIAFSGSALAKPATETVDLYGQIAISIAQNAQGYEASVDDTADKVIGMDNESRIGVRGVAQFERGPKLIWQLEGGNVGDDGSGSGLGVRDTYGGFDFDEGGKLYFGRVLTPLFEVLDGYTGQSSGGGFSTGNTGNVNYDRQSNMIRYDSSDLGGFSFDLAAGRGEESIKGSNIYGASGQFNKGVVTAKLAYEHNTERPAGGALALDAEMNSYIAGLNLDFDVFGVHLAYLNSEAKAINGETGEASSDAVKVGAYYVGVENWTFNLNYASNSDPEVNGAKVVNNTSVVTGQAMYSLDPAAVVYVRAVSQKNEVTEGSKSDFGWRVGMEYYF
ncbi:porin [Vibrio lamellibrachiae]|uniref:porin n=1 Tax=Vibrio lamellibrachiae TaxID=2910253 RepID=UPI003D0E8897